jgi:hypothetical protein
LPAPTDAAIWGALPPDVFTVVVMSQPPAAEPGTPIPSPITVVGLVAFSVTVTVPAAEAVNVRTAVPPGAMTTFIVSVPGPAVGVVVVDALVDVSLLHPAQSRMIAKARNPGRIMRPVKNPLL